MRACVRAATLASSTSTLPHATAQLPASSAGGRVGSTRRALKNPGPVYALPADYASVADYASAADYAAAGNPTVSGSNQPTKQPTNPDPYAPATLQADTPAAALRRTPLLHCRRPHTLPPFAANTCTLPTGHSPWHMATIPAEWLPYTAHTCIQAV